MVPWCCSTIILHTASPKPGLPGRVVKRGSKTRSRSFAAIPVPESANSTQAARSSVHTPPEIRRHPPSGIKRKLFKAMFSTTCCRRSRSAATHTPSSPESSSTRARERWARGARNWHSAPSQSPRSVERSRAEAAVKVQHVVDGRRQHAQPRLQMLHPRPLFVAQI